jgi:cation-transporting ATPase 13A1
VSSQFPGKRSMGMHELIDGRSSDPRKLVPVTETGKNTILTLAAAHALVLLEDGTIVGDPMEKTTLAALDWKLGKGQLVPQD